MDSVLSASHAGPGQEGGEAFVYFYDPSDVVAAVRDWPAGIRLAMCLNVEGTCEFVLFHDEEESEILPRVAHILGRQLGEFATNPKVEGYPERHMRFSEESALLRVLGEDDELLEAAQDYKINYGYASEEGIDPASVCMSPHPDDSGKGDFLLARRSVAKIFPLNQRRPRRPLAAERPQAALPQGFIRAAPEREETFDATLRRVGGRIRLQVEGADKLPVSVRDVALRADLSAVHLSTAALGRLDLRSTPVDMPAELFPDGFVGTHPSGARVTATEAGLFVSPIQAEIGVGRRTRMDRIGYGVRTSLLAGVGLIATGFLSSMVAHAVSDDGKRDLWAGPTPTVAVFDTQQ